MIPTINHWVGQQDVIKRFRVALEAAWNDGTRLPHMLFTGPPGVGKTELAHLAAKEMCVEIHERIAQVVSNMGMLNGLLMQGLDKDIIFLDEIHELLPNAQTLLYRAMEGGQITISKGGDRSYTIPIKDVTVFGATTDEYALLRPLRDRFKLILPFTEYSSDDLAHITLQRAKLKGIQLSEDVAVNIAERSRGTPRLAIRLLESCYRYARSQGEDQITPDHFNRTVELDGIDHVGLGSDEQRYLRFLARRPGEPIRLMTLESALAIHRRTIQSVVEPYLIQLGFIERQQAGRVITNAGLDHLENATALVDNNGG